jgi:hypothetical protein
MSISALSNDLREILNDRHDSTNPPSSLLYKAHLQALDSWHAELPVYTCLQTPNWEDSRMVNPEADYRQKTAIVSPREARKYVYMLTGFQVERSVFIFGNCLYLVTARLNGRFTRNLIFKRE